MLVENLTPQMKEHLTQIKSQEIKIVSFDIFDTLLVRPVINPDDIWQLVGKVAQVPFFLDKRRIAAADSIRYLDYLAEDRELGSIYESYGRIFNCTKEEETRLAQLEMDIEYDLLYPRQSVKCLYDEAIKAGKEVIIASDMYLSIDFISKLLIKNGYDKHTKIYLSSETRLTKKSGNLFNCIINDYRKQGISPSEILHIGDNHRSDYKNAIRAGMKAIQIPSTIDRYNRCRHLKGYLIQNYPGSDNIFFHGMLANYIFDDPYREFIRGSRYNGEAELLGYTLAPFIISFVTWMMGEAKKDEIEQFVFVYRDGYLPQKIYEILGSHLPQVESTAMYLSRAVRRGHYAKDTNGLFDMLKSFFYSTEMTVGDFIRQWVLVQDKDDFDEILHLFMRWGYVGEDAPIGALHQFAHFLHEIEPYFKKNAIAMINLCDEYVHNHLDSSKKVGVFDCGSRFGVNRFLDKYYRLTTVGYSMCADPRVSMGLVELENSIVKAYVPYGMHTMNRLPKGAFIFSRFIEDIVREPASTVLGLKKISNEIGYVRQNTEAYIESETLSQVQKSILDFTQLYNRLFGKYVRYLEFDRVSLFDIIIDSLAKPYKLDAELITQFNLIDSDFMKENRDLYQEWYDKHFSRMPSTSRSISNKSDRLRVWGYQMAERLRVLTPARRFYRFITRRPNAHDDIPAQVDVAIEVVQTQPLFKRENIIMVVGDMNNAAHKLLDNMATSMNEYTWIYFNTRSLELQRKLSFPVVAVPHSFTWGYVPTDVKMKIESSIASRVRNDKVLDDTAKLVKQCFPKVGRGCLVLLAHEISRFYEEAIATVKPKLIVMWNSFTPQCRIANVIAMRQDIPVAYMETGVLPGTLFLETGGQFGASWVARESDRFMALPVNDAELEYAKKLINDWRKTGANRYVQSQSEAMTSVLKNLDTSKKTIFLAGEGFEGGNYPHDKQSQELHTPMFGTSYDAIAPIAAIAKRNGWNLIYKPHPIIYRWRSEPKRIPSNVIFLEEGDINAVIDAADLVIGVTTSVTYTALIRGKPTLTLGYNQLKGKGCAYEAFSMDAIEPTIKEALSQGYTDLQQKAFVKHVAQLNKYYLFDNLTERPLPSGQGLKDAISLLENAICDNNSGAII
ncbi:MAG: hypothetical protein FWC73_03375 [Defluviitaleaceae bacterium]|nr:hypothetical protein [Defluviitaleaceae bacterium]